jgi:hypothetical protein
MRKLSYLIIALLLTGCSGEETGWRTKEGFQQRKEYICERWDFFASSSTSNLERSSLIQDLQNGFKELADTTGDAKYAVLLAAADHYAQTQNLDDGIVWRIAKYCENLAYGKE